MELNKICFMGSTGFALESCKALHNSLHSGISMVFTKPDAPKGRGQKLVPTPLKEWALENSIPVIEPRNKEEVQKEVFNINPDLIVIIAYGMILPKAITDNYFCINAHASLLPKFRGPSPVQSVLLAGEKITGITIMKVNEKMDQGPILLQEKIEIEDTDDYLSLSEKLSGLSAELLPKYINTKLRSDRIAPVSQDHSEATYCRKITKEDLFLDLSLDPEAIVNKVRAFSPFPGAYTMKDGKRVKILEAEVKDNILSIKKVKPEGKGLMDYNDYLLAHPSLI
ncbi:methionyl-tRNA formyltransferase [Candidatus Margulisiibacteriota bacterium]